MRRIAVWVVALGAAAAWAEAPAANERVTVSQDTLTLPWHTAEPNWKTRPNHGGAFFYKNGTAKQEGEKTFDTVVLENEFVKVDVVPGLGGVIHRAIHKPTGNDYFYREEKAKNYVPYWESGVKICFPYHEHGLHTEDQPVARRVVTGTDGSKTLAMWMEFSRFREPWNTAMFGRHNWATLAQFVTLRPGENAVHVRYRVTNEAPYRQGRRIWADAFFPRNQTKDGAVMGDRQPPAETRTQWVFPTAWVSDHGGNKLRKYGEEDTKLAAYKDANNSIFAWDSLGFAGLFYPDVGINRLGLWNPAEAPGAKQFFLGEGTYKPGTPMSHLYNLVELWGGSDHVFEGVEHWIEPGETYEFSHTYTLAAGMGKARAANGEVVIAPGTIVAGTVSDQQGNTMERRVSVLQIAFLRPHPEVTVACDELPAQTLRDVSPARVETLQTIFPKRVTIRAGTDVLYAGPIMATSDEDTTHHAAIKATFGYHAAKSLEMRAADPQNKGYRGAITAYPEGSTDRGRVLYRDGQLDETIACLTKATAANADDGEAWHLLGVAQLEKGNRAEAKAALTRAIEAKKPYPTARYYLAMVAIADDEERAASAAAKWVGGTRLKSDPPHPLRGHWPAQLLAAYVEATAQPPSLATARDLERESPADPRVAWIVWKGLENAGDAAAAAAKKEFDSLISQEPGAKTRVEEFAAATRGEFVAPPRMDRFPPAPKK